MNAKQWRLTVLVALGAILVGVHARGATIPMPDSDDFNRTESPVTGWHVSAGSGTWSANGSKLVAAVTLYNLTSLAPDSSADSYSFDQTKKLVIKFDMNPALGGEASSAGIAFLVPGTLNVLFRANGGVGYYLLVDNGGLKLYRDWKQWDGPGNVVGSSSLPAGFNTTEHSYRIEVTCTGGTAADFEVFFDDESKITYTDGDFLPLKGYTTGAPYTSFKVGFGNQQWPGSGTTTFDNFSIEALSPLPPPPKGTVIMIH